MTEPIVHLTADTLERLANEFVPKIATGDQLAITGRLNNYQNRSKTVESSRLEKDKFASKENDLLEQASKSSTLAHQKLSIAKERISLHPNNLYLEGNLKIILGHIQVALYQKTDHLPLPLQFFKGWARPTHPYLDPYLIATNTADQESKAVQSQVSEREKQQDPNLNRKFNQQLSELANARRRLFLICEEKAISDQGLIETYISIIPERAHLTAEKFADKAAFSDIQLSRFYNFLSDMNRLIPDYRAYAKFHRQYQPLAESLRVPTSEDMSQLDKHARELWKAWITYTLEENLAAKGLIISPNIPEIFQKS